MARRWSCFTHVGLIHDSSLCLKFEKKLKGMFTTKFWGCLPKLGHDHWNGHIDMFHSSQMFIWPDISSAASFCYIVTGFLIYTELLKKTWLPSAIQISTGISHNLHWVFIIKCDNKIWKGMSSVGAISRECFKIFLALNSLLSYWVFMV